MSFFVIAHNIRSLYNIGSIFRTCDALGVDKLFLTGYSGTPPRVEISKSAIGAEKFVNWEYHQDPLQLIQELKKQKVQIVALEQTANSFDYLAFEPQEKICLILGHEVLGVDQSLLDLCDAAIEIPMHGKKASLNVAVAFGVGGYLLNSKLKAKKS